MSTVTKRRNEKRSSRVYHGMTPRRLHTALLLVIGLLTMGTWSADPALASAAAIRVVPAPATVGTTVTVFGQGFCATASCGRVEISLAGNIVASGHPGTDGAFAFHFVVHAAAGQYAVTAAQSTPSGPLTASVGLLVLPTTTPPQPPQSSSPPATSKPTSQPPTSTAPRTISTSTPPATSPTSTPTASSTTNTPGQSTSPQTIGIVDAVGKPSSGPGAWPWVLGAVLLLGGAGAGLWWRLRPKASP